MNPGVILLFWMVGIGLLSIELFVPSLVAGALGTVCVLGAIGAMFGYSVGAGVGLSVASVLFGGGIVFFASKRLALRNELKTEDGFVGTDDHSDLVGTTGVTTTMLRPGGFATIGGKRIDVVTQGELIEKGTPVEVVAVEGNRVEVRATS